LPRSCGRGRIRRRRSESEEDDAGRADSATVDETTVVEIECEHDATIGGRGRKNLSITPARIELRHRRDIVSGSAEPFDEWTVYVLIREDPQRSSIEESDLIDAK
jgi:hypothetical protein